MSNEEAKEFRKLHQQTIIALCVTILLSVIIYAVSVLVFVPNIVAQQRAEQLPGLVKQALNEVWDERLAD